MSKPINERYIEVAVSPPPNVMGELMDTLSEYVSPTFNDQYHDCYQMMMEEAQKLYRVKAQSQRGGVLYWPTYTIPRMGARYHTGRYEGGGWVNGITIHIEILGGEKSKPDDCIVKLYNTVDFIGKDSVCVVKAGYLSNFGTIFIGRVNSVESVIEGADKITTLRLTEYSKTFLSLRVNDSWRNTKYTDIIGDMIRKHTELTIGYIHPSQVVFVGEFIMTTDYPLSEWLNGLIKTLNTVWGGKTTVNTNTGETSETPTGWTWKIIQGRFYLMPSSMAMPTGLYYEAKSGLINVNENFDGDGKNKEGKFNITVMMDPRINSASIINVKRKDGKVEYYKVSTFKFISDGDSHQVDMQCVLIKDIKNIGYLGVPIEIEPIDDMEYGDDYG